MMTSMNYDNVSYDWLVAEGRRLSRTLGKGHGVDDLLAMSQDRDPYYRGRAGDVAKAEWFRTVWQALGLDIVTRRGDRVHLRRVHYMLVSRSAELPSITWGATPGRYLNTEEHWVALGVAAMNARYLGMVPFAAIEDQRNPDPRLHTPSEPAHDLDPRVSVDERTHTWVELPIELVADMPDYAVEGYVAAQRYHCEIWVEKSTMEDVLLPVCRRLGTNLMHASGELSITQVFEAARRIAASRRPARVLYVSDYDPAGQRMPVSAGRKLEWLMHGADSPLRAAFAAYRASDCDVTLTPIALTEAQIAAYDLPKQPLKDQKGKDRWELLRGEGGVELDALEALHPGALARIVEQVLGRFYDSGLTRRVTEARAEANAHLSEARDAVLEQHRDALDALERDYATLRAEMEPRLSAITDALDMELDAVARDLEDAVAEVDIGEQFPVPTADVATDDDPEDALVWSERTYDEQLEVYHAFQRRDDAAAVEARLAAFGR